MIKQLYLV